MGRDVTRVLQVEERNAKLLQTLSEATDMLAEADEMQADRLLSKAPTDSTVSFYSVSCTVIIRSTSAFCRT